MPIASPAELSNFTRNVFAEEALYSALGKAFARWQHIETAFYLIWSSLLDTDNAVCSTMYFENESFARKLNIVDKLCQYRLDKNIYGDQWKPLKTEIENARLFRNGMAHFEVQHLIESPEPISTKYPIAMTPHHMNNKGGGKTEVKAIFIESLVGNCEEFLLLARNMIKFGRAYIPAWERQLSRLPPPIREHIMVILGGC